MISNWPGNDHSENLHDDAKMKLSVDSGQYVEEGRNQGRNCNAL